MTGAGEERIASLLIRALHKEYDISLVLFNGPVDYELPPNIEITYLRKISPYFIFRAFSLPLILFRYFRFCKKNKVDISLSFDNTPNYVNCLLKLFGWNGKVWIREVNFPSVRFKDGIKSFVHRSLIKWSYPKADILFVNALRIKDDLINNFKILKEPIALFNNPISLSLIKSKTNKITKREGKIFKLVCVGAFRPQKNHKVLIQALNNLKHLDFVCYLIGKGPLEQEIRDLVNEYQLEDKVKFLGFQSNPFKHMYNSDIFVLSSDFEGLPNVLLESLVCNLPIVSTDCPSGPREVLSGLEQPKDQFGIEDQFEILKHGIICPVGNANSLAMAIEHCYQNPALLDEFKKGMDDTLKPYREEVVISKFKMILQNELTNA